MASGELSWHFSSILLMEQILLTSWAWQFLSLFIGFYTSQVVSQISSINRIILPTHPYTFFQRLLQVLRRCERQSFVLNFFSLKYPRDATSNLLVNKKPKQQNHETARTVVSCYHPPLPPKAVMASENFAAAFRDQMWREESVEYQLIESETLGSGQTPKWP